MNFPCRRFLSVVLFPCGEWDATTTKSRLSQQYLNIDNRFSNDRKGQSTGDNGLRVHIVNHVLREWQIVLMPFGALAPRAWTK